MASVLYLSYDGLTDPLGKSQIIPYISALSGNHEFIIISFEKKNIDKGEIIKLKEQLQLKKISWKPLTYHKWPPVLSTIWDILILLLNCKIILRQKKIDIIHCRSYITAIVGLLFRHRARFLFDMRGFYADERRESGLWPQGHFIYDKIYAFFKWIENKFLDQAHHIISLTHAGKEVLIKNFSVPVAKVSVIPCSADLDFFSNPHSKKNLIREHLGICSDAKVFVYAGSLGTWYLPEHMMRFFKLYHDEYPNSYFLILNKGEHQIAFKIADKIGVSRDVLRLAEVDRQLMPQYLQSADAGIFFIYKTFSKTASSPVKMGEMLASGLPVIANSGVGDVDQIIEESGCGILVYDFSKEEFIRVIREFESKLSELKSNCIQAANKYFNLKTAVETYETVYSLLVS